MRYIALYLLILFIAEPAFATEMPVGSLFFTPSEIEKIETPDGHKASVLPPPSDIHLGAVLYYAPDQWVVWLDGERWTPETRRDDLQITEVRPRQVQLRVRANGLGPAAAHDVVLKPYQTYRLASGQIQEGSSVR